MTEQNRLLTDRERQAIFANDAWCLPHDNILNGYLQAQAAKTREMTLKEVGEWLDTKWVSYGTFAFIKLSDEEMKLLKQGKWPGGS